MLGRGCEPLSGFDADNGGNRRDLEAMPRFAEILLDGIHIEPPGDLLGGGDEKVVTLDFDETASLKFFLERLAYRLCAFQHGIGMAERLSCDLASRGLSIISGMARGVDAASHRGALNGRGKTIAVWGTGIDQVYPRENKRVAEAILEGTDEDDADAPVTKH